LPTCEFLDNQQIHSNQDSERYVWEQHYKIMNVVGGRHEGNQIEMPLSGLFKRLSALCATQQGITEFVLTRTTLEQVFVSFARFQHAPDQYKDEEVKAELEGVEIEMENRNSLTPLNIE